MAGKFVVPWTLSDDNEFGVPGLPWFFTYQEAGICLLSLPVIYLIGSPLFGTGLVNFAFMVIAGLIFIGIVVNYKADKPASWLWDLRHALGMLPQSRGVMQSTTAIRCLSAHHAPRPSVFVAGKKRAGYDLTASNHVLNLLQPAVTWRPLMVAKRRRRFVPESSPAPCWFQGANGFETLVNPRMPITVVTDFVDANAPAQA